MIPFDAIDDLMMPLEERMEAFYMRTLTDSSRSLSSLLRAKNALNPATFYSRKYLAADQLYDSIVARVAKLSGYTEKELRLIFKRAGFESLKDDAAIIGKLGLEVPELATSDVLTGAVNAVFARTNAVLQNLTRSIAYQSEMAFIGAVDDAYLAVSTGTLGINQAIKQGVLKLADQGVRVLNSQTGRVEQADVAIKRNIWTGINQATGDMTLALAAEAGTDLVEVSAHPGARSKGSGPMNHASWQGKVYSISGMDPKYEALIPVTGYGTGPGLLGYNCRHSLFLFFEGYEKPAYTQNELDRMNNTQVTYNGKQMDLYEATQQQRYFERGVRDWKRKQAMFEAAGLGEEHAMAGVKVQEWQARLRDFTKQTGLERRMEWEQVAGVRAVRPSWGKSTQAATKLTDDESWALKGYQSTKYRYMNDRLRHGTAGYQGIDNDITTIEKVINRQSLPQNTTVYRGSDVSMLPKDINKAIGSTIKDEGFLSTSLEEMQGRRFAAFSVDEGKDAALWEIRLPKGTKALNLSELNMGEAEMLLQHGYSMRIVDVIDEKLNYLPYGEPYISKTIKRIIAELIR